MTAMHSNLLKSLQIYRLFDIHSFKLLILLNSGIDEPLDETFEFSFALVYINISAPNNKLCSSSNIRSKTILETYITAQDFIKDSVAGMIENKIKFKGKELCLTSITLI